MFASALALLAGARAEFGIVRAAAPSATTIAMIICALIGGVGGFEFGGWWTSSSVRSDVNAEWVAKIAAQNPAVKAIVAQGDADSEAVEADVLKEIGETYAKLKNAESRAANARKDPVSDRCSVPVDCLQ